MDDKRNIILAMVLTGLILFGWPYIADRLFPGAQQADQQVEQQRSADGVVTPGAPQAPAAPAAPRARAAVLKDSPRIAIETPKLHGSIALKGARIDDVILPTYQETQQKICHRSSSSRPAAPRTPISLVSAGRVTA